MARRARHRRARERRTRGAGQEGAHRGDLDALAGRSRIARQRRSPTPPGSARTTSCCSPRVSAGTVSTGGDRVRSWSRPSKHCLQEGRTFPPPKSFAKDALVTDASVYDDAERDWQGFWAQQALALDWHQEWHTILDWELPFAKWFVGGTLNVSENCLDRHVNAGHGDQVAFHWEGEPGDSARRHLRTSCSTRRAGSPTCCASSASRRATASRSTWAWSPRRSPRCSRARASAPPHSVVFGGFTAQSLKDRINDAEAKVLDHRRRRVAARLGRAAEGHRRRGAGRDAVDRARARAAAHRERVRDARRARPLVARRGRPAVRNVRARVDGRRGPALHPLHVGHHREAQGHHAHDRRLSHAGRVHAQVRVRPAARHRRVLVHGRRRLGDRPLVHRVRTAREPRDVGALRRHARLSRQGSVLVDRREVQGHDLLHRADRDPNVHEVGRRVPGRARPLVAAADRHRRRTDQSRGVGLVLRRRSAANAARSSTRGGRPRPARS